MAVRFLSRTLDDRLWTACDEGSGSACDELFAAAPVGSEYERFGVSCGDRPDVLDCAELDRGEQPPGSASPDGR